MALQDLQRGVLAQLSPKQLPDQRRCGVDPPPWRVQPLGLKLIRLDQCRKRDSCNTPGITNGHEDRNQLNRRDLPLS